MSNTMTPRHSLAPWRDDGYRIYDATGRMIVEYKHVDNFNNADSCLLTAAPELLDLCRTYWQSRSEERWLAEEPEIYAALKAVIAKAEGR